MRIAPRGSQHEVLLFAGLDRKAKKTSVSERGSNTAKHACQVSDVDEYIGGNHKIELFRLRLQILDQLAANQIVVDLTLPCDFEHVGRHIDSGQRWGERMKSRSDQTRATTHVQNIQIARRRETRHRIKQ